MMRHLTKSLKPGRPKGSTRYEPESAQAFGRVVRALRVEKEISQENLASLASIDRSFMGRIERGETTPTLTLMLKITKALNISATVLVQETEELLGEEQAKRGNKDG
jgi:transcriptional regulator with XRE-family HTH domain